MSPTAVPTKRPIKVSLNSELVQQARGFTRNLSGTLEALLRDFVAREQARRSDEDETVAQVIAGLDACHRQYGLLSDEFSTL